MSVVPVGTAAAQLQPCAGDSSEQECAATLRERSLLLWAGLAGWRATLTLFGGVSVDATLVAADATQERLLVADMDSGVGLLKRAQLRASDVEALRVGLAAQPELAVDLPAAEVLP